MIERIEKLVKQVVPEDVPVTVEISEDDRHGHYATSVAMRLAKLRGKNPRELAEELAEQIQKADKAGLIEKIQVAAPGFINLWLKPEVFQNEVAEILAKREAYSANTLGGGKQARVEYVSANPTGPIHFGNVRGGPIGETLSRVFEKSGYKVLREYIHNDVGNQVDKLGRTFWYWYEKERGKEIEFPKDGYPGEHLERVVREAVEKLGKNLTEADLPKLTTLGLERIFAENLETLKKIGITFDYIVKESELLSSGKTATAVEAVKKAGAAKEQDGALWFAPRDEFLEDRESVIIRSDGRPTYFASDIAYHKEKFESGADLVIDIFGSNHHGHVPKLQALATIFHFDISKFRVILYQYVRLKKGNIAVRMQKRDGNFVTAKTVIEEIGADSMIFFLLMNAAQSHMDFDPELAKEKSMKNPVYYAQYAHVRATSILEKANNQQPTTNNTDNLRLLAGVSEMRLIQQLVVWPDVVRQTVHDYEVHRITRYATEVARAFHNFYEQERVIGGEPALTEARLALVRAAQTILKDVFHTLAISAPVEM